jgi:CelD/BcsL family acetyltransferase involved in cellulose biosynthesis
MKTGVQVEVLRGGVELIDALEPEWLQLCAEGPCDQPYQRPEWTRAYVRHFATGREVVVFAARGIGGKLLAVLPLLRESRWLVPGLFRIWKLRGPSMENGFPPFDLVVASREEALVAVPALWSALHRYGGWHVLELPNVVAGGEAEKLTQAASDAGVPLLRLDSMRTPHLSLGGWDGKDAYRIARSKNLRHTIKRIINKVGRDQIAVRRVTGAAAGWEEFFALEKRSWKGKEGKTVAGAEKLRSFYREISQAAERFGYLSFYFLDLFGKTVATRFAWTYRGCYGELECVHDEEFGEYAPGHLVIAGILEDCARRGFPEVDFSGHTQEYKEKWTSDLRSYSSWYIYRNDAIGRLLRWVKVSAKPMVLKAKSAFRRAPPGTSTHASPEMPAMNKRGQAVVGRNTVAEVRGGAHG